MKILNIKSNLREEFIDVTKEIKDLLHESKVVSGSLTAFVPHTTAAITINENADPDVATDMNSFLSKLIPQSTYFRHSEGNSDAHLKSSILGPSLNLLIDKGALVLGTWQGVYFCDFDGPRNRKLIIKIFKEN